ncbi:hypothetical protein CRUP_026306 [Coryphaenoides rupestris]|nr:hypothetical protein CRUP_026306 [Coryphaenoides rupestris]
MDTNADAVQIPERLLKREQARLEDAERRKEARERQTVTGESNESFSRTFSRDRAAIEELLASVGPSGGGGGGAGAAAAAARDLDEATVKTLQLQKFLNDSMTFLVQYEVRQAQGSLQKLQSSLAEKRDEVLPKKKFAFRSRTTKAKEQEAETEVDDANTAAASGVKADDEAVHAHHHQQCGFSNMDGVLLTKAAEEIQGQDVLLSHLTDCRVRLFGSPSTLHIKDVRRCEILCGPVSSSVFVDRCVDSTLAVACQQLRTHNASGTQVYLHVTSRAIIEDCRGVAFAPFTWSYPTLDEDFAASGLDRARNNWTEVDDFNWLAAGTHSPNWTVIPEEERKTSWEP